MPARPYPEAGQGEGGAPELESFCLGSKLTLASNPYAGCVQSRLLQTGHKPSKPNKLQGKLPLTCFLSSLYRKHFSLL